MSYVKQISKLKASIDTETQLRMQLAQKEQEVKDPAEHTKIAFLIGKSDEKVQALAVLMLHFCAGLQHTQDQEEASKVIFLFLSTCIGIRITPRIHFVT